MYKSCTCRPVLPGHWLYGSAKACRFPDSSLYAIACLTESTSLFGGHVRVPAWACTYLGHDVQCIYCTKGHVLHAFSSNNDMSTSCQVGYARLIRMQSSICKVVLDKLPACLPRQSQAPLTATVIAGPWQAGSSPIV